MAQPSSPTAESFMELGAGLVREVAKMQRQQRNAVRSATGHAASHALGRHGRHLAWDHRVTVLRTSPMIIPCATRQRPLSVAVQQRAWCGPSCVMEDDTS